MDNSTILLVLAFVGGILATLVGTRSGVGKAVIENFKNKQKDSDLKADMKISQVAIDKLEEIKVRLEEQKAELERVEAAKDVKGAEQFWKEKL